MGRAALLAILMLLPADDFLGRWDLTIVSPDGQSYPSWLEVTREAGTLKARVVGRGGSVFPVPDVAIEDGGLRFQYSRGQSGAAHVDRNDRHQRAACSYYQCELACRQVYAFACRGDRWSGQGDCCHVDVPVGCDRQRPGRYVRGYGQGGRGRSDHRRWRWQRGKRHAGYFTRIGAIDVSQATLAVNGRVRLRLRKWTRPELT